MFKKLSDLENKMCIIMSNIHNSQISSVINSDDIDISIAFHQCIENGYIENISEFKDANGHYHFDSIGYTYINQNGLKFLRNMSLGFRIKNAIFDIFKGTLGFFLGILSTVIAEIIIWMIMQKLQNP